MTTIPPSPSPPRGCQTCGTENVSHARGLQAWCSAHAPAWAYQIPRAPIDPQERAAEAPIPTTPRPLPGATVLYTVPNGPARGKERPAIVVEELPAAPGVWLPASLHVFYSRADGLVSGPIDAGYSAAPVAGHWRWP